MSDEVLEKKVNEFFKNYCDHQKFLENIKHIEKLDPEKPSCWICWRLITGEKWEKWRESPFHIKDYKPSQPCPICGYRKWARGGWLPIKFLLFKKYGVSNPSVG